jgi:hypothetical protein
MTATKKLTKRRITNLFPFLYSLLVVQLLLTPTLILSLIFRVPRAV